MGNLKSIPSNTKYDVFLSFRGEDTRDCFTSHLYKALRQKQIETFIDYRLIRGDEISPALMKAIEESKISVVIFSKDYASSKWCLRELVEILNCKKTNHQIVLPVFYRVEPSVVRNQTGSFEDSFVDHDKILPEEVITWRQALAEASNISGWHSSVGRTDAELVAEIVDDIWKKLMSGYIPPDFGELIGLKPRIEHIISSLLCLHVKTDVRIIGIWGMGGIGKTTLADAIFNQNKNQFEGVSFIQNVREKLANSGGVVSVQKEILSKVLKDEGIKLDSLTIPPNIKERLKRLKVFIVLDDVDNYSNMKDLVKGVDGLGQGSRIIITSRDKQALRNCYVTDDNVYEVKRLSHLEALHLFCMHAFHENRHSEDPMVNRLVKLIDGNPLVLKVLGSALHKKSEEEWESVVNKFEPTNLSSEIFDMLKISYDGLTDIQRGIFLAIACYLKGRARDYVAKIFDDCDYHLSVLIDKSLIIISSYREIEMHDLLEEMGRNIVIKESPNEIGKRSWLWRQEDVLCTLENDVGTPEVQGIVLDVNKINKDIHLSPQVFKKMYNLRFIKFYDSTSYDYSKVNCLEDRSDPLDELSSPIWSGYNSTDSDNSEVNFLEDLSDPLDKPSSLIWSRYPSHAPFYNSTYSDYSEVNFSKGPSVLSNKLRSLNWYGYPLHAPFYNSASSDYSKVNFSEGLSVLSNKLRSLIWHGYPLQALPSNLNPNSLVELDLRGSNLETLCEDCTVFPKLRWLNLSGCTRVTKIPDLSKSPLLEMIHLQDCRSLLDFPLLAQHLKYLVYLCCTGCTSLRSFPSDIHFESVTSLDFNNCNNLTKFPQISSNNITGLDLSGTTIKELHHSISHLNGLEELFLGGCKNLETLPRDICNLTSLQHLDLSDCSRLEILPKNLGDLKSLKCLSAKRAAIKELPHSIAHLNGLEGLFLQGCENLETLPSGICKLTSLQHLDLSDCSRLEILPENWGNLKSLKHLSADRIAIFQLLSFVKQSENVLGRITHSSGLRFYMFSLRRLFLSDCNLNYIPEDIGCLTLLEELDLSVNNFDGLPQSMVELLFLKFLHLDNCNGIASLIDLPSNLTHLSACDCKQLQSIPNELDFARFARRTEIIFTNCMNIEETAVGNMLERLMKCLHQGHISFTYPGSEVPKWFRYTTEGSSIKFQGTFDGRLKGFAVCTVIAFEKYLFNGDSQHKLGVHFHGTSSDGDQSSPTNIMSKTAYFASRNRTLIDSDHVAFGYCYTSYSRLFERELKNYSFEFRLSEESPNCRVKSCGVCPIYFQDSDTDDSDEADTDDCRFDEEEMEAHPKENKNLQTVKYAEPIEHVGETSGIRRSRTSNDHLEEEVEPHPKRVNI